MATNPFLLQRYSAQSAAITIVRNVLKKNVFPDGYFTTKQIYKLATEEPAPPNFEPYPLKPSVPSLAKLTNKSKKKRAVDPRSLMTYPEHPEHPIRSIRFLKEYVLPHLQGSREIVMQVKKVKDPAASPATSPATSEATTKKARAVAAYGKWAWKVVPPEERLSPAVISKANKAIGREVGVGEDVSHLNKRRKSTRVGKVSAQVLQLKSYKAYSDVRDPLISRLKSNPILLKKVSAAIEKTPTANLDAVLAAEKKALRHLPGGVLESKPIEGEDMLNKLENVSRHLAFSKPKNLKNAAA